MIWTDIGYFSIAQGALCGLKTAAGGNTSGRGVHARNGIRRVRRRAGTEVEGATAARDLVRTRLVGENEGEVRSTGGIWAERRRGAVAAALIEDSRSRLGGEDF